MYIKSTMQKNYMPNAIMHSQLFYIKEIWSICLVIEQNYWEKKSWIIFRAAEKLGEGFSNCVWKKILTGASFQNERDF